jgi:hypothetical protein
MNELEVPGRSQAKNYQKSSNQRRNFMNATAVQSTHRDSHNDLIAYTDRELGSLNQKDYLNVVTEARRKPFNFISTDRYLEDEDYSQEEDGGPFSGDEEDHVSPLKPKGNGCIESGMH